MQRIAVVRRGIVSHAFGHEAVSYWFIGNGWLRGGMDIQYECLRLLKFDENEGRIELVQAPKC